MVAVPAELPVTMPVEPRDTVRSDVDQVPPGLVSIRVILLPTHTVLGPLIEAGDATTVIIDVLVQPRAV